MSKMEYPEARKAVYEYADRLYKLDTSYYDAELSITGFISGLEASGCLKGWSRETYERLHDFKTALLDLWFI